MGSKTERPAQTTQGRDYGYDTIRCVATVMIVIWHFYTTCHELSIPIPTILDSILERGCEPFGVVGVALFFMLSGALLIKRYKDDFEAITFYKRRMLRILLPLWIGFIGAFLATYIVDANIIHANKIGMVFSFFGLNFFNLLDYFNISCIWIIGEWFTSVIIVIYILFPFFRWLFNNHRIIGSVLITCIFIVNLKYKIMSNEEGWASYTNGFMCFWIGMLFERYKAKLTSLPIACTIPILLFTYLFNPSPPGDYGYIATILFSAILFLVIYSIKEPRRTVDYICKYSYEIYLVHHRIFLLLMPGFLASHSNYLQIALCFIMLVGLTCLIAEALHKASDRIIHTGIVQRIVSTDKW